MPEPNCQPFEGFGLGARGKSSRPLKGCVGEDLCLDVNDDPLVWVQGGEAYPAWTAPPAVDQPGSPLQVALQIDIPDAVHT